MEKRHCIVCDEETVPSAAVAWKTICFPCYLKELKSSAKIIGDRRKKPKPVKIGNVTKIADIKEPEPEPVIEPKPEGWKRWIKGFFRK